MTGSESQTAERLNPAEPDTVKSIVATELRPLTARIDSGYYPNDLLRRLGGAGAFRQHSVTHGSGPAGISAAIDAMTEVATACVSTAFCTWCQDALIWYIDRSDNTAARSRHIEALADGRLLGGTALSNPMKSLSGLEPLALTGSRVAGGYQVTGRLPFVSNLGPKHLFAAIFARDDSPDRLVMGLFHVDDDTVRLAQNAHFIALEGTATYSVQIRAAFVSDDDVLSADAATFIPRIRQGFVLLQAGMALGAARGAARLMRNDAVGRRHAIHLPLSLDTIDTRCNALQTRIAAHIGSIEAPDRASFIDVLRTRLDLSWLALEAVQSTMLQFGARGYLRGSEASRRFRETQFVALITPSTKHILAELAKG